VQSGGDRRFDHAGCGKIAVRLQLRSRMRRHGLAPARGKFANHDGGILQSGFLGK
jgi:hypothetical protein